MDPKEKAQRLRKLLLGISSDIESIPRAPAAIASAAEVMESAAVDELRRQQETHIDNGLRKMAENRPEDLTTDELGVLEAIVLPENRPAVYVRNGSYDSLGDPWTQLNLDAAKSVIDPMLPLIGRVELPHYPLIPYGGTGFVVGPNLLMTNRHVAALFSSGLGLTIRYASGDAVVNLNRQYGSQLDGGPDTLEVRRVIMVHPYWDMALLLVDGLPNSKSLNLSIRPPEEMVGRNIVVVGYPARDPRSNLELQDKIFENVYNVKRLQPGTVRERLEVRSFENVVKAMVHDSSTLGGNSGSAVIDAETGEVLALHFGGEYLKANYAVPMYELARDSKIVAQNLNFDGSAPFTNNWQPAWERVPGNPPPPPAEKSQSQTDVQLQSPPRGLGSCGDRSVTWTIPLQITVSLGEFSGPPTDLPPATVDEEAVVVDPDYASRPGYNPKFLDIDVPLPRLSAAMEKDTAVVSEHYRNGEDQFELAYYHYSVYMNKRRRTAWFSAANVDGSHRQNIGKRQGDRWFRDPRIDKSEQLGQEAFEHGIDRGHLTRREDTAWGKSVASALRANNDTFHFTNCSLQASMFNRGKDRWQGLEQFLLEQHAKKDKRLMVVITGPLFAPSDPVYQNDKMDYSVKCPLRFWKVCVLIREDETLAATGFILGQDEIRNLPGFEEGFDVAATQIKISDLEKRTGLDFGDLNKHDHFAQGGQPDTLEVPFGDESHQMRPIYSGGDIVL
jgi:endonuclease G, mitochondrial